jgi:hypothetical protein
MIPARIALDFGSIPKSGLPTKTKMLTKTYKRELVKK